MVRDRLLEQGTPSDEATAFISFTFQSNGSEELTPGRTGICISVGLCDNFEFDLILFSALGNVEMHGFHNIRGNSLARR